MACNDRKRYVAKDKTRSHRNDNSGTTRLRTF